MEINGKTIRDEILADLKNKFELSGPVTLAVIWVGDDPATAKFIEQKRKFAELAGVEMRLFEYDNSIDQDDLEGEIERLSNDDEIQGIIVQLPLPDHIDTAKILSIIPGNKDVDALGPDASVPSPVVAAIQELFSRYDISFSKNIVVLGNGKLVGRPVSIWLAQNGANVTVLDQQSKDINSLLKEADVIISGVGQPGLITPEMIKDGVILIDAGTNEQGGRLAGDALASCSEKAALFTPVPGGVGPIVVAELYKNLWRLSR